MLIVLLQLDLEIISNFEKEKNMDSRVTYRHLSHKVDHNLTSNKSSQSNLLQMSIPNFFSNLFIDDFSIKSSLQMAYLSSYIVIR